MYQQDGEFLHEYLLFEQNDNIQVNLHLKLSENAPNFSVLIPVELTEEEIINTIPSEYITKKDDNTYFIHTLAFKDNLHFAKDAILSKSKKPLPMLKREILYNLQIQNVYLDYKKNNNSFVYVDYHDKINDYQTMKTMSEKQAKFLVLNKSCEEVNYDEVNLQEILYGIRNCIAHNKDRYRYNINNDLTDNLSGKLFILDKHIVIFPYCINPIIARIISTNEVTCYNKSFMYCPTLKHGLNPTQTETIFDVVTKYLQSCRKITLSSIGDINFAKIEAAINHCLTEYKKKYNSAENLHEFLTNKLEKIFQRNIEISIQELASTEVLANKLIANPYFLKWNTSKYGGTQDSFIRYLVEDFYMFNIIDGKAVKQNGKFNTTEIDINGISTVIYNVHNTVFDISNNQKDDTLIFDRYKDEIYISTCIFLAYMNLIHNGFNEDLDKIKSKLNLNERYELQTKLKPSIFSDFTKVNTNKHGNNKNIPITEFNDMINVISSIRNQISHFNVKVKFNKSGNYEEYVLIFEDYDTSKPSNIHYKITIKDFLKFITNPIFSEYKTSTLPEITANTWEELIDKIKEKC